jgi:hypothetical protein
MPHPLVPCLALVFAACTAPVVFPPSPLPPDGIAYGWVHPKTGNPDSSFVVKESGLTAESRRAEAIWDFWNELPEENLTGSSWHDRVISLGIDPQDPRTERFQYRPTPFIPSIPSPKQP